MAVKRVVVGCAWSTSVVQEDVGQFVAGRIEPSISLFSVHAGLVSLSQEAAVPLWAFNADSLWLLSTPEK